MSQGGMWTGQNLSWRQGGGLVGILLAFACSDGDAMDADGLAGGPSAAGGSSSDGGRSSAGGDSSAGGSSSGGGRSSTGGDSSETGGNGSGGRSVTGGRGGEGGGTADGGSGALGGLGGEGGGSGSASPGVCGDGFVDPASEECEPKMMTGACAYGEVTCEVCSESCVLELVLGEYCGDGVRNGGESCDGEPYCSETCTNEELYEQCEACIMASDNIDYRDFNEMCNGDPLCVAVKQCLVRDVSAPGHLSCFDDVPAECYCGMGADFTACELEIEFEATGACREVMEAGVAPADSRLDVLPRLADANYPTGQAVLIIDEASRVCADACGFSAL